MDSQWDVCEKRDGLMDGTVRPTKRGVLKAYAVSFCCQILMSSQQSLINHLTIRNTRLL